MVELPAGQSGFLADNRVVDREIDGSEATLRWPGLGQENRMTRITGLYPSLMHLFPCWGGAETEYWPCLCSPKTPSICPKPFSPQQRTTDHSFGVGLFPSLRSATHKPSPAPPLLARSSVLLMSTHKEIIERQDSSKWWVQTVEIMTRDTVSLTILCFISICGRHHCFLVSVCKMYVFWRLGSPEDRNLVVIFPQHCFHSSACLGVREAIKCGFDFGNGKKINRSR